MTIFDGSSADPDRDGVATTTTNPGNMKGSQMELGKLFNMDSDDQEDDVKQEGMIIFPAAVTELDQHEMVYKCVFHLEPDMVKYYYTPPASMYSLPKHLCSTTPVTVLQGSPEFQGFHDTKWQISVNLNRWIGMHRWMSIYLTRVDENLTKFQAQCEFKLVGKTGQVVFSQRNNLFTSGESSKGSSLGFGKFLPFSDVVKHLIDCNKLSIEVHLSLFLPRHEDSENKHAQQEAPEYYSQENQYEGKNYIDDTFYCPPSALLYDDIPTDLPKSDIPEADRIEIQLNDLRVAYACREKLKEKSAAYLECVKNEWDCSAILNLQLFSRESPAKQIKAIRDYVNFIHGQPCSTLVGGSYRDAQVLLQLALKLDTEDLVRRCLTCMTLLVDCENAMDHSRILDKFLGYVNQEDFRYFSKFFKDNFLEIRKTERFLQLKNVHSSWLIRWLFD